MLLTLCRAYATLWIYYNGGVYMNKTNRFISFLKDAWIGWQVVALIIILILAPILSIIMIALDGIEETYKDFGVLLAVTAVIIIMAVRYLIRRIIAKIKKDEFYFARKKSLIDIYPTGSSFGIVVALILSVFLGTAINPFWFVIVAFFGSFLFLAHSFSDK